MTLSRHLAAERDPWACGVIDLPGKANIFGHRLLYYLTWCLISWQLGCVCFIAHEIYASPLLFCFFKTPRFQVSMTTRHLLWFAFSSFVLLILHWHDDVNTYGSQLLARSFFYRLRGYEAEMSTAVLEFDRSHFLGCIPKVFIKQE